MKDTFAKPSRFSSVIQQKLVALLGFAQRSVRRTYTHILRKQKPAKPLAANIKATADWIRIKRQQQNLAPYQLAAKMGIATSLVQLWESGISRPDDRQWRILSDVLVKDVSIGTGQAPD